MSQLSRRLQQRTWLLAAAVLVLSLLVFEALIRHQAQLQVQQQRVSAQHWAREQAQVIESRMQRLLSSTYMLAALVHKDTGQVNDFERVAKDLWPSFPGLQAMALAPNGVIRYIWPLENNRAALNTDLFKNPDQAPGAALARDTGLLTLDGPLPLVQGGWGMVGRLPILLNDRGQADRFWGLASVSIRFPEALVATGLPALTEMGYDYRLWRERDNGTRDLIAESAPGTPLAEPVEEHLRVPNGDWVLALAPRDGWQAGHQQVLHGAALVVALLLAYVAKLILDLRAQKALLEDTVQTRTEEVVASENQLRATLDAIPDLLFELDIDGRIFVVHTSDKDLLLAPPEQLVGRRIDEFLPADACAGARDAMKEALRTQGRVGARRYVLDLPQGQRWFEYAVSYKNAPADALPRFIVLSRDITRDVETQSGLLLASKFFEGSNEGLVITDAEQRIVQINPAFTDITGYSAQDIIGKTPASLSSGRQSPEFYRAMWSELMHNGQWQGEIWNRRKNGDVYPEWLSISRVDNEQGETTHYIAIFSDISRRREQEARIRDLAYFDSLTGLANRTLLKDRVRHDLTQARRRRASLSLLFIDLDHFKQINDSLGHQTGDQVLIQVSQRLQHLIREQDTVSRLGGDEFVAVLPDTDADGASYVARHLLQELARPYQIGSHDLTVTPSIGIAVYPSDGGDFDTLYRCADTAMYRAKQEGRNGYSFFTPEMQQQSMRRLQLENGLRRTLERDQLELYYQPQLSLKTGQLVGMEALLRWHHPEWGMVPPAEFIPVAESSGQILAIGEWVLRRACEQAKRWMEDGLPPLVMAVNLSAVQFRQPQLPELIQEILHGSGLPPACLELELTESAAMHDPESAVATMDALHQLGVLMSVDDFGTGYSSLNYLKRFQVYKLKIDQSFVRDVLNDPEDANIVDTIIRMAHGLGLVTIAEGVESQAQMDFLRQRGCEEIQGYFLNRPLPAPAFEAWVRTRLSAND